MFMSREKYRSPYLETGTEFAENDYFTWNVTYWITMYIQKIKMSRIHKYDHLLFSHIEIQMRYEMPCSFKPNKRKSTWKFFFVFVVQVSSEFLLLYNALVSRAWVIVSTFFPYLCVYFFLPLCLSLSAFVYVCVYLCYIFLSIPYCVSLCLPLYLHLCLPSYLHLSTFMSTFVYLCVYLFSHLSAYFFVSFFRQQLS